MAPDAWGRGPSRSVRVQIDGVASPIDGVVRSDRGNDIAIEQPLPFLKIGRGATLEAGERAERRMLSNVELVIDGDVPRLVLTLSRMSPRATAKSAPPDMRSPEPSVARSSDETLHDDSLEPQLDASPSPVVELPSHASSGGEWVTGDAEAPSSIDTGSCDAGSEEPARGARAVEARADDDSIDEAPVRAARDIRQMREREPARAMKLEKDDGEPSAEPNGSDLRERLALLRAGAAPPLAAVVAKMRTAWAITIATTGPWTKRAVAWLARTARAVAERVRARAPERLGALMGKAPKRRTTAAPPAPTPGLRKARGSGPEAPVVSPLRGKGRLVLAGIVGVLAVGLTAYALALPSEAPAAPIEVHRTPVVVAEPIATAAPIVESSALPAEVPVAPPVAVEPPSVPAAPGGHLPPPTFPSLGSASSSASSTAAIAPPPVAPTASASEAGTSTTEFGAAAVTGGRVTTLHMSQPITSLVGQADESGFTVTIHGALSLDRAGPIAAANPSVERASIINRGDHSVLTVRFVAGRSPSYRVAVRGQAVEVTLGR